jgi:hypothetical protein
MALCAEFDRRHRLVAVAKAASSDCAGLSLQAAMPITLIYNCSIRSCSMSLNQMLHEVIMQGNGDGQKDLSERHYTRAVRAAQDNAGKCETSNSAEEGGFVRYLLRGVVPVEARLHMARPSRRFPGLDDGVVLLRSVECRP